MVSFRLFLTFYLLVQAPSSFSASLFSRCFTYFGSYSKKVVHEDLQKLRSKNFEEGGDFYISNGPLDKTSQEVVIVSGAIDPLYRKWREDLVKHLSGISDPLEVIKKAMFFSHKTFDEQRGVFSLDRFISNIIVQKEYGSNYSSRNKFKIMKIGTCLVAGNKGCNYRTALIASVLKELGVKAEFASGILRVSEKGDSKIKTVRSSWIEFKDSLNTYIFDPSNIQTASGLKGKRERGAGMLAEVVANEVEVSEGNRVLVLSYSRENNPKSFFNTVFEGLMKWKDNRQIIPMTSDSVDLLLSNPNYQ